MPSELPVARRDSRTAAQFAAMPTAVTTLRGLLIKQGKEQQAQAIAREKKEMARAGQRGTVSQPQLTDDDWAFDQATTLLWNPLAGALPRGGREGRRP